MRSIAAVACGALLLTAAAATAQTTQDRATFVTFSGPVTIPGKTLPAGTYTFKLADSPGDRHIVQIFDKDQSQILATLLAVPADRAEAAGDPVITFKETSAERPPAVHYWYYAGERAGNEFVYPKNQAMMIARASGESVMAVDTDSTDIADWQKGTPTRVTPNAEPQSGASSATTTSSSSPTPTTSDTSASGQSTTPQATQPTTTPAAQPTTTPGQTPAASTPATAPSTDTRQPVGTSGRSAARELPHTASEVPTVGLIGLLALAGALALRVARRATV